MITIPWNEYHTSGRWILDSGGHRLLIRGVSKPGMEYLDPDLGAMIPETMNMDLDRMKSWGFNAVRLPLRDLHWLQRQDYRDKVDEWISQIRLREMLVILDFHLQQDHPRQDGFMLRTGSGEDGMRMWSQLSEKYTDPSIFFELFNEPFQVDPSTWWYGNDTYYGYRDILREVRQRSDNVCILGGMDYAYQWSFLKDRQDIMDEMKRIANLALATHPYGYRGTPGLDHVSTLPIPIRRQLTTAGCSISIPMVPKTEYGWDESFGFLLQDGLFPLLATEWGLDHPDTAIEGGWYNTELLDYMTDHNMSHVAWAWVQDRLDYPSLIDPDFQPTGSALLTVKACASWENRFYPGPGQLVRNHMQIEERAQRRLSSSSEDDSSIVLLWCMLCGAMFLVFFLYFFPMQASPPLPPTPRIEIIPKKSTSSSRLPIRRARSSFSFSEI